MCAALTTHRITVSRCAAVLDAPARSLAHQLRGCVASAVVVWHFDALPPEAAFALEKFLDKPRVTLTLAPDGGDNDEEGVVTFDLSRATCVRVCGVARRFSLLVVAESSVAPRPLERAFALVVGVAAEWLSRPILTRHV